MSNQYFYNHYKHTIIKYIFGIVDIDIFSIKLVKNFANFDLTQILHGVKRTRGSIMYADRQKNCSPIAVRSLKGRDRAREAKVVGGAMVDGIK